MLNIVIFDDNEMDLKVTFDILNEFLEQEKKEAAIVTLAKKEDVISYIQEHHTDVVFLDILIEDQVIGIELAKQINELSEHIQIVFLTGFLHYATDIYDTKHIYYVLKTELRQRLPGVFSKIETVLESEDSGVLHIKQGANNLLLEKKNISYIERNRRISSIYYGDQIYTVHDKLSDMEQMMDHPDFVRCHNSYIVNLQHVLRLERKMILLKNGVQIPISRARNEQVKERFLEWMQKYM